VDGRARNARYAECANVMCFDLDSAEPALSVAEGSKGFIWATALHFLVFAGLRLRRFADLLVQSSSHALGFPESGA
jgi:hypothetical protein